ncbi:MAG: zinc ribbon domain-containing protein [Chloroflexota bacterium]|nr:MAG: zinc ribbon domain-containing protein [Chloroflexota bacterium]
MEQRIYHGDLNPKTIASALIAKFDRGNLRTQQLGSGDQIVVQVATRGNSPSGGQTSICVTLQKVPDGVSVQVGKQAWLGVAASLGMTALSALRNPLNLLGRLDDIAQDIESLQLTQQVWESVAECVSAAGASTELSERLRRLVCNYCETANPVGEPNCIACGAPLGGVQPFTCLNCGFVVTREENVCPNCGEALR